MNNVDLASSDCDFEYPLMSSLLQSVLRVKLHEVDF